MATPKIIKINRPGLKTLVHRGYTHGQLAEAFSLSRNWTIQVVSRGVEPRHPGITEFINKQIDILLKASA